MPAAIFLDTAIAFLKRYKALIVILPLCLALAWQTYQVSRWKGKEAKAQATIAQMQLASEQARAKQIALNTENAQLSQRIATDATLFNARIIEATNRNIADRARSHSLRAYCEGRSGGADTPAVPVDPGQPSDGGTFPDMVVIPRHEFETISRKAVQDDRKTSFLVDLVNEGLAVSLDYPEPQLSVETQSQPDRAVQ